MSMLEVVQLPGRPAEWDRTIEKFATKKLFHESAWLDFAQTIYPGSKVEYFEIRRDSAVVGYFCVVRVNKAMVFPVYGSPLPDSGVYMGPIVADDMPQADLVQALIRICKSNRIASLELSSDWLAPAVMLSSGFTIYPNVTNIVTLSDDEDAVWAALKGTCRTRIRKAEKSGLEAQITTDVAAVDDFYRYFTRVLRSKGRTPPYGPERLRSMMQCLTPADRLICIRVMHNGRVIGVGFYPHDHRSIYYWDGASDLDHLDLCPNELLHWTAMKEAIRLGIPSFNIGGGPVPSQFTRKFGGTDVPFHTYRRSFVPFLETARAVYHMLSFKKSGGASDSLSA